MLSKFIKNRNKKKKAMPNRQLSFERPAYPIQSDFYEISLEKYGGELPIHSVRMSFVLPYDDWCEFSKSNLYKYFQEYLLELKNEITSMRRKHWKKKKHNKKKGDRNVFNILARNGRCKF